MRDHIDDVRDRENEIGGVLSIFCDVIIPYSGALPCNQHKIYFGHVDELIWHILVICCYHQETMTLAAIPTMASM